MKYSRKSYRKKATYRRKRTFKKKKQSSSAKMMASKQSWTNQTWTQSYAVNNSGTSGSPYCTFLVDALGNFSVPVPNENYHSMALTQSGAQAIVNKSMQRLTITAVGVKLIFPENFAGNNPISWAMSYNSGDYAPTSAVQPNPSIIQVIQGSQTGPVPASRTISRFFRLGKAKKALGISYTNIDNGVADFSYYGQLGVARPFIQGWVQNAGNVSSGNSCGTQIQVTYYARYQQLY